MWAPRRVLGCSWFCCRGDVVPKYCRYSGVAVARDEPRVNLVPWEIFRSPSPVVREFRWVGLCAFVFPADVRFMCAGCLRRPLLLCASRAAGNA